MTSEGSAHGHLALYFWAYCEELGLVEEGAVHLMTDKKQRKIRAGQVQYTLVAGFLLDHQPAPKS